MIKRFSQPETLRRLATTRLPTEWGAFQMTGFERKAASGKVETALGIVLGDVTEGVPLLRIHSQCLTGEVFKSLRCDCAAQLEIAMHAIADEGRGLVIYEHQEGRGIGLMSKLRAYALQDKGFDTVEANHALGFASDYRDYTLPAAILQDLGISRVRLLSNNPDKTLALLDAGIEVVEGIPCEAAANSHSLGYLQTKKEKMGHALTLGTHLSDPTSETFSDVSCDFVDCFLPPTDRRSTKSHERTQNYSLKVQSEKNRETTPEDFEFATIEAGISELRAGRMIVVIDDEDRENEGDLTMAAEMITPEAINFMATHGKGLICLAMTGERLEALELDPMVPANSALGGTAFTVSIDVRGDDITTGISAYDRAQTIKAAVNPSTQPEDFARPGHVFPLRARAGGVLERRGQTEAAVDLATLAGLQPAGVICEIVKDDGTMARVPDLIEFCQKHGLLMITVAELARYRFDHDDDEGDLAAMHGMYPVCSVLGPEATPPARATHHAPYLEAELIV